VLAIHNEQHGSAAKSQHLIDGIFFDVWRERALDDRLRHGSYQQTVASMVARLLFQWHPWRLLVRSIGRV